MVNNLEQPEEQLSRRYAQVLLHDLGFDCARSLRLDDTHPAQRWRESGLQALTGAADGPPLMCPAPLAACADGALAALQALVPDAQLRGWRGAELLSERAQLLGHTRRGPISPGGSCRLLPVADGCIALNLARDEDWDLLPAWLEEDCDRNWDAAATLLKTRSAASLVARGRELGLAVADARVPCFPRPAKLISSAAHRPPTQRPRVIELASLWAGPLCGRLLQACGAEVIKVESVSRPDGARRGPLEFFERLNAGKQCLSLDLAAPSGREELRALIRSADIVIEGSRPRALRQLGIRAETLLAEKPGLTWLGLSGYGRGGPEENWVAYGDDAAVAGGLSQLMHEVSGQWLIAGDAIADPLTGLHAALRAWAVWQGGGGLVSSALSGVVAQCINFELPPAPEARRDRQRRWAKLAV